MPVSFILDYIGFYKKSLDYYIIVLETPLNVNNLDTIM